MYPNGISLAVYVLLEMMAAITLLVVVPCAICPADANLDATQIQLYFLRFPFPAYCLISITHNMSTNFLAYLDVFNASALQDPQSLDNALVVLEGTLDTDTVEAIIRRALEVPHGFEFIASGTFAIALVNLQR